MIRFGIHPLVWSNDDLPELGGDTPLETCLKEASDLGYEGVELGRKMPREPETLEALLSSYGLCLVTGWTGTELLARTPAEELERLKDHLDLLVSLGCRVAVVAEVSGTVHSDRDQPLEARPVLDADDRRRLFGRLDELALLLADRGLSLAYHPHLGTVIETAAEVEALIQETREGVGLVLDTGHLAAADLDPVVAASRWAERIRHVHLKDVRPEVMARVRSERRSFLDGVIEGIFAGPGDGVLAFQRVLVPLAACGYAGWLVVEADQDPRKVSPKEVARRALLTAKSAAAAAGLC